MTQSHGIVELKSENEWEKINTLLSNYQGVQKIEKDGDLILVYLNNEINTSHLNQFLFENGIVLSHLKMTKPSLEQRFLDLTAS
jgi:ABC-2 type transport system ATP-binding protein